ncbi:macro domain-containing protein [Streptomyces asiaticus]|uniref:macro domain-containing protein n=1 Tax=Streptomyces asiaticus TaxID=114695 RepID=UPI0039BECCB8
MSAGHNFGQLFSTRRGLTLLTRNSLGAFGLLSGALQIALALWASIKLSVPQRWGLLVVLLGASLAFGIFRAWPRRVVSREFDNPDICVTVQVGDLFDQQTHLIIGFTDAFDTDTTNNLVISRDSVQGQFQEKVYGSDLLRLDAELESALTGVTAMCTEDRAAKPNGKLCRYPVGTVVTLGGPARYFFCVAYSRMQNNLIAQSDVDSLWKSLGAVWEAVYVHGQRKAVSISIVGSELARISCLNRESLLKMIALSFVARSRQSPVCKELRILVHPKDYQHINMLEVDAFLRTL